MKLFTIPNLLTLGNLFCGCLAIIYLSTYNLVEVPYTLLVLIGLSLFFDLLDGMVARAMKINSEIGVQLDSLADMVSFGVVPGLLMAKMIKSAKMDHSLPSEIWILGLFITLFSALRLAKFNIDTEQSTYFKGLNTPANTILIFSYVWLRTSNGQLINPYIDEYVLIGLTIISCWLLISNIPIFSFKLKGFAWKDNDYKYVFIIISILLLVLFQMNSVPFIILLYIITSILFKKKIIHVA